MVSHSKKRSFGYSLLSAAFLGVAAFLTWKYALGSPENWEETKQGLDDLFDAAGEKWDEWDLGNFSNVLDGLDGFSFGDLFNEDPMLGDNTTISWHRDFIRQGGLNLKLLNALDEEWQQEFDVAVSEWQKSDALVLSTERVAVDHTCQRVDGVMVVCNANFGATGWVGINENSIMRGVIVSSVAKMNEYYLNNANFFHRRYTMCHELGHGFGLPHTDENPYNSNQGNCLDYTDDPEENLLPGEVNMAKLRDMYLNRNRRQLRRLETDGTVVETTFILKR